MSLTYPTAEELRQESSAVLARRQPQVDPTITSSWARTFLEGNAINSFSVIEVVKDLEAQLFPQTADGEFLERWAAYENISRLAASPSEGAIIQSGTAGTVIPIGTSFRSASGLFFESTAVATIVSTGLSISSITRVGTTATATTSADHGYATGVSVTISGANESEYNGTVSIVVTSSNTFTYTVEGAPATPATGTISSMSVLASVAVRSVDAGSSVNIDGGGVFTIQDTISGVSGNAFATFDGITGGADEEDDEALRARVLLSRSIIQGVFTEDQVILAALGIAGNTRVFVVRPILRSDPPIVDVGTTPAPGQVVVYILRDNDSNIIPSQTVLNNTKQAIIDNGKLPTNTTESDLFVFAPDAVPVDFVFSSLTPDTPTMRQAVIDQLAAFFEDQVQFQSNVTQASYLGAINNTEDLQTNTFIESFSVSTPSGDVAISDGQIAILGDVSFA